jgi:ABC-2 type transport system ATP-binding protein
MSVSVDNLSKSYGSQLVLDAVSFIAQKGQITGFLGPNGAGKTTTMKVITSFILPDEGQVLVDGVDVTTHPLEVRKKVGYLPENNALYLDMYVREYLAFMAGIHKLKSIGSAVDDMIDKTGLGREAHKKIGTLSKGYRQRVGLAQAMIHDPDVLILDEPTSGLDPNQLVEIRKLIKDLGREKTVIFSTHIMQEVQALCDRVVIINKGRLVADKAIDELTGLLDGEQVLTIELKTPIKIEALKGINGVITIDSISGTQLRIHYQKEFDIRETIFNAIVKQGGIILEMHKDVSSVEDVFQTVTR